MKHYISVATVIHTTIKERAEVMFSLWSAPVAVWLCNIAAVESLERETSQDLKLVCESRPRCRAGRQRSPNLAMQS
jgi:hypothetical protein